MNKNHIDGIFSVERRILEYFHYILPTDFQKPKKTIYFWHYAIIIILILYAVVTIIDVCSYKFGSLCSIFLWILSSLIVFVTVIYSMSCSEDKIWKELLKNPQFKNRAKHINEDKKKEIIDTIFKREIYSKALNMEKAGLIIGMILIVFAWTLPISWIEIFFKFAMGTLAFLNCFILIAQNLAEFYKAKDRI